jgi:apolipoprotein D and lipocalin family protein
MSAFADFNFPRQSTHSPQRPHPQSAPTHPTGTTDMHPTANQPVPAIELARYLGLWHEMAHLPMFFQRKCSDQITATYIQNADGTIGVLNACRTHSGAGDCSRGIAKPGTQPGALKVTFVPRWLCGLPFVWADYWIIDLDSEYQWSVVGSPTRKYLWILGRQPTMNRNLFLRLVEGARARGYPVERLVAAADFV